MSASAQSPTITGSFWTVASSGLMGGAGVSGLDALVSVLGGAGGPGPRALWLVALGIGLGATAGVSLAFVARGLVGATAALWRTRDGRTEGSVLVGAVVLGTPLVAYDVLAMFAGPKASKIPGRLPIAVALMVLGALAIAAGARVYIKAVRQAETQQRGARRPAAVLLIALIIAGVVMHLANRVVLPRLYPWFHGSLSVLLLVTGVLAARLALAMRDHRGPCDPATLGRRSAVAVFVCAIGFAVAALPAVAGSHSLRFAAYERTQVAGLLLRGLPLPTTHPRRIEAKAHAPVDPRDAMPLPEGPRRPQADVFLITVDALRADHVGAYGYSRRTTPYIDALAARGLRFKRAYAQAPHTSFSVASMLTGKYYPTLARLSPGDPHDPIANVLRRYGWKTAAFYPPAVFFVDAHKLKAYQENNFQFEYVKVEYMDAPGRLEQIEDFFRTERPEKAFVWLHLFEPHEPYEAREGFSFGSSDVDRYDSEIAYADAAIGKLLAYIEKNHPGAIVILTADHGEEFDDHGSRYHGSTLYDEQVRVPLIIAIPGVAPHVVGGQVELIDLAPTILGLLDIPVPVRMRGTDLGPWLGVPAAPERRLPPAFAEIEDMRMVVWGNDKLVCQLNWGYCELYDLLADPREKRNIAEARPDRAAAMRARLDAWLDDHVRFEPQLLRGPANPEGGLVPRAIERGRLGDLSAVSELATMLASDESLPVRREAARLLVSLPPREETKSTVFAALRGVGDPELKSWTAVAAARLGDDGALEHLRSILGRPEGSAPDLQVQAALALAHVGDRTGVDVLGQALDDKCEEKVLLCRLIIIKLGDLKDPRAIPALLKHLPEVQNRREMVQALGKIAGPIAIEALTERLRRDEYVSVRVEAARALGKLGSLPAREALSAASDNDPETSVRVAAAAALKEMAGDAGPSLPPATTDKKRSLPPQAAR